MSKMLLKYANIVSNQIHTYINIFFLKCCMVGCSIPNIFANTTQIESIICKLVEQKLIYVT